MIFHLFLSELLPCKSHLASQNYSLMGLVITLLVIHCVTFFAGSEGQLRVGFYSRTCPAAESIVHDVVRKSISDDPKNAPKLLRLLFHDCFVQGCDGSILLSKGERDAGENAGLAGFEVIETAKTQVESVCPGVVSCSDILALATRDAVVLSDGPSYEVPTGRRDGRVSSASLAANLPDVNDPIEVLKSKFKEKGLSDNDLVLLSGGGHTIGSTACFFMTKRLYNFGGNNNDSDPAINPQFLPQLKAKCPVTGNVNARIPLDWSSESVFDDQIFSNIRDGFAVLASDARLYDDENTKQAVDSHIDASFKEDFAQAMVKMGNLEVKTGSHGEIRRICSQVN